MKKMTSILLAMLLVLSLSVTVFAAETVDNVRSMIEALSTVEEFKAMDAQAQLEAYNRTQAAYDAYMALSEEEREKIEGAEAVFDSLFGHFNAQVMPITADAAQEVSAVEQQAEVEKDPLSSAIATALSVVAAVFLLKNFKKKKI